MKRYFVDLFTVLALTCTISHYVVAQQKVASNQPDSTLSMQDSINQSHAELLKVHEKRINDNIDPLQPVPPKWIPIWMSYLSFVVSFILILSTFVAYGKVREAKKIIESAENKIIRADEKIEKAEVLYVKTKEKMESLTRDSQILINKFLNEANKKIKDIDELKNDAVDAVEKIKNDYSESFAQIEKTEKELGNHRNYLQQSVDHLFYIAYYTSEILKNKELYERQLINRAVVQLYSLDKDDRFNGIGYLGEHGRASAIEHLERVIVNPEEDGDLKLAASDAIRKIKNRLGA